MTLSLNNGLPRIAGYPAAEPSTKGCETSPLGSDWPGTNLIKMWYQVPETVKLAVQILATGSVELYWKL
jgi:hypothetical protein